ncbi:MAG: hypothetical protein LBH20_03705 [Treponema sp.]|jgi:hypothetical protein|nr:hypothetical protein [Treponema sp.]
MMAWLNNTPFGGYSTVPASWNYPHPMEEKTLAFLLKCIILLLYGIIKAGKMDEAR